MVVAAVAAFVGAAPGVVFEFVALEAVLVVGSSSSGPVTFPQGSSKLPIARSLASDDWGYATASRCG